MGNITALLARANAGEREGFDAIFERHYPDLQRIARARVAGHDRNRTTGRGEGPAAAGCGAEGLKV